MRYLFIRNTKTIQEAVSYTHLDVYKRQILKTFAGIEYESIEPSIKE